MQENNFENQVQQKMEELKINPSEAVWEKVALGIEKRKRDWRLIYIFSLLFLLVGTISVIWWNTATINSTSPISSTNKLPANNEKKQNTTKDNVIKSSISDSGYNADKQNKVEEVTRSIKKQDQKNNINPGTLLTDQPVTNIIAKKLADKNDRSKNSKLQKHRLSYRVAPKVSVQTNPAGIVEDEISPDHITNQNEELVAEEFIDNEQSFTFSKFINKNISINTANNIKKPASTIEAAYIDPLFPAEAKLIPRKEKQPWKFGLNLSVGVSTTRSSFLGIVGSGAADKSLYSSSPITYPNGSPGPPPVYMSSAINTSKAFIIGAYAQKQLTSKTSFLIGLNYKYYSTTMTLGFRVDSFSNFSNASFYYRSGNSIKYFNRYHFIELPAGILFRLSKRQNKLPVYLYTGLSVSQLIKTTALQFDIASGSYYHNDAIFNKTQLDLSARILFSITKKRRPLLVGPDLNYSLTKTAGTGLYSNRHYSYLGIYLQKGIGKNKMNN